MKRLLIAAAVALAAFGAYAPSASAQAGERIVSFDARVEIRPDSSIRVVERIVYDFGEAQKHGIYRDIPVKYGTSYGTQSLKISDISVTDADGAAYGVETSNEGRYKRIRIGNPDTYVSGARAYVISYVARRALGYFDGYDELYWNATGNEWGVTIERATATLVLPGSVEDAEVRMACYVGRFGSSERCSEPSAAAGNRIDAVTFESNRLLGAGEGLTVAVGFPKGLVAEPSKWTEYADIVRDNPVILLPLIIFAIMFSLWYRNGRDPKGRGTVVPEYDAPDGLTPLETAAVLTPGSKSSYVSAEIVSLAERGWMDIERVETVRRFLPDSTDYVFTRKQGTGELAEFDKLLLDKIFVAAHENADAGTRLGSIINVLTYKKKGPPPADLGAPGATVKLSDLKNKFYRHVPEIWKSVLKSVVDKGYYPSDPDKVRAKHFGFAIGFFLLVWFAGGTGIFGAVGTVSLLLSGFIIAAFSYVMPKATEKGARAREAVLGLKDYLQIAEKDRLEFHNAPEKNPKLFERLLPYAMALGVEKAWAKEFQDMYMDPPSWYRGPVGASHFNTVAFASDMGSFNSAVMSNMASAPGSSSGSGGGGFSGGGGGGGGGGSW